MEAGFHCSFIINVLLYKTYNSKHLCNVLNAVYNCGSYITVWRWLDTYTEQNKALLSTTENVTLGVDNEQKMGRTFTNSVKSCLISSTICVVVAWHPRWKLLQRLLYSARSFNNRIRCRYCNASSKTGLLCIPSRHQWHQAKAETIICITAPRAEWFRQAAANSFKKLLKHLVNNSVNRAASKLASKCSHTCWSSSCLQKSKFSVFCQSDFESKVQQVKNSFKWFTWRQAAAKPFGEASSKLSCCYINSRAVKHDHPRLARPNRSCPRGRQSPKSRNSSAQWSLTCKKHSKIGISRKQRIFRIYKNATW